MARRGTIMPEKERASQEQIHKPGAGWLAESEDEAEELRGVERRAGRGRGRTIGSAREGPRAREEGEESCAKPATPHFAQETKP